MDITSLIQFIASSSIIMAALTFLAKRFIAKSLDAAIERYKSTLEKPIHNSRMVMSIYGIERNQFKNDKTIVGFPTIGISYFLKY